VNARPIRYAEQQAEHSGHDHSAGQKVTQIDPLGQWTPINCSNDDHWRSLVQHEMCDLREVHAEGVGKEEGGIE